MDAVVVKPEVSIVVPAFNEAGAIREVVASLRQRYPNFEILVVDDGSTDGMAEQVRNLDCRLISHNRNKGYGASWKTGIRNAGAEIVCFFDGDGQLDPDDVGRLLKSLIETDADMVVGARTRNSNAPLLRKPGKYVLTRLADFIAREKIPDLNCGLRVLKKNIFVRYLHLFPDGFSASTTSTLVYFKRHLKLEYVPITVKRRIGNSSARQLRDGTKVFILMLRLIVLFEPLRFFLPITGLLLMFSLFYSVFEIVTKGLGFPVLGAVVFIGGLLTFLLGVLSDQISSLRLERYENI